MTACTLMIWGFCRLRTRRVCALRNFPLDPACPGFRPGAAGGGGDAGQQNGIDVCVKEGILRDRRDVAALVRY
jgi:hypothetical protein